MIKWVHGGEMGRNHRRLNSRLVISLALAFCSARLSAQTKAPVKRGGFSASFIGEGGGYQHPSGGAGDYMESVSRQEGGQGTFGPVGAKPDGKPRPMEERRTLATEIAAVKAPETLPTPDVKPNTENAPSGSLSLAAPLADPSASVQDGKDAVAEKGVRAALAASDKGGQDRGEENVLPADSSKYSLWEGLVSPLELPAADVARTGGDQASELVRKDYDSHILGRKSEAADSLPAVPSDATALSAAAAGRGEIFVSFELEVKSNPDDYRDALSGLSRSAEFRLDPRFDARRESSPGKTTVFGWMPADKISAALSVPTVSRLHVENAPTRPAGSASSLTEILVGVRSPMSPNSVSAQAILSRVIEDLASSSGFQWKKTIGYQPIPGSKDSALILLGKVPVKNLSAVLAHRDVIKIVPSPDGGGPDRQEPASRRTMAGFISYAVSRAPILLGVTLLMALSSLGWGVFRLLRVLAPAR